MAEVPIQPTPPDPGSHLGLIRDLSRLAPVPSLAIEDAIRPHLEAAIRILGALASSLWLLTEDRSTLTCRLQVDTDLRPPRQECHLSAQEHGAYLLALAEGALLDGSFPGLPPGIEGTRQSLHAPVIHSGCLYGVLRLDLGDPLGTDAEAERAAITILADLIAHTLERRALRSRLDLVAKQAKDQALAGRMEALVRLSGLLAHDFNNLLTAILGYGAVLSRELHGHPGQAHAQQIHQAAERAASLTRQLQSFGRKIVQLPRRLDLNVVLSDLSPLLKNHLGPGIDLSVRLCADSLPIQADRAQLEQALIHMLTNAKEAMPKGGSVRLETTLVQDEDHAWASLVIADTGVGIPPELQERVFEPFCTSKDAGKYSGFGLSISYGIIRQNNGHLELASESGKGTRLTIRLPINQDGDSSSSRNAARPKTASASSLAGKIVLVAEDDHAVRELLTKALREEQAIVHPASDGFEADRVARSLLRLDVLVTDVVMPGHRGPELARRLRSLHPDLVVLAISGWTDGSDLDLRVPGMAFLAKPFTREHLLETVKTLFEPG